MDDGRTRRRLEGKPTLVYGLTFTILIAALSSCDDRSADVGGTFDARAVDVCTIAIKSKQDWQQFPVEGFDPARPDPAALPAVATWLAQEVAPTFETWLGGLQALGEPETNQKAWSDVLAAVEEIVRGNADEIDAAKAGDTAAFVAAHDRLVQIQPELERATAAAGVPRCADVHAA
jgi:hypothetical protein